VGKRPSGGYARFGATASAARMAFDELTLESFIWENNAFCHFIYTYHYYFTSRTRGMPRPCRLALMLTAAVALSPWGSPGRSRGRGGRGGSGEGRGSWGGCRDGLFTSGPLRMPTTWWEAGLTLVPISAQLELTLPLFAQRKLTLSPISPVDESRGCSS
jgi:hypothetical protein